MYASPAQVMGTLSSLSNPQSTEQLFVAVPLVLVDNGLKRVCNDLRFYTRCFPASG